MVLSINKEEIAHYRSHHSSQSVSFIKKSQSFHTKLAYRQIRKVKIDYVKYQNKPQYGKMDFFSSKEKKKRSLFRRLDLNKNLSTDKCWSV